MQICKSVSSRLGGPRQSMTDSPPKLSLSKWGTDVVGWTGQLGRFRWISFSISFSNNLFIENNGCARWGVGSLMLSQYTAKTKDNSAFIYECHSGFVNAFHISTFTVFYTLTVPMPNQESNFNRLLLLGPV